MSRSKVYNSTLLFVGWLFCLLGLAVFVWAVAAAPMGDESWKLAVFGLMFSSFGFLAVCRVFHKRKEQARRDQLRALYPDKPWMRREDWAQGRAQSKTRTGPRAAWIIAILSNAVSAPILYSPLEAAESPVGVFVFLIPPVGVGLLIWAIRTTLRWKAFGNTWFELTTVTGVLGKQLEGRIWTRFAHLPERGVLLKLTCFHRHIVPGTSKGGRSIREDILWRDEQTVPPGTILTSPNASAVPVRFQLPANGTETKTDNLEDSFHWILTADASLPGVDYHDEFEVPVFRTKETPSADSAVTPAAFSMTEVIPSELERSGIRVRPSASGGTGFYFSAARNVGTAMGITAFFALFTGAVWLIHRFQAPLVFLAFFGLADVLLFVAVLQHWLGTATVTAGAGVMAVQREILGLGRTHRFPAAQLAGLRMKIGTQSGGRHGTPYYHLQMVLASGKERTLANDIRDKRQAEWLLAQMSTAAGLKLLP